LVVFHVLAHCRPLHDLKVTPSIAMSTRTMLPPFAEPVIVTIPAAGDGAVTVTEVLANATGALRTELANNTKIAQ
jgi:hypothetical protein